MLVVVVARMRRRTHNVDNLHKVLRLAQDDARGDDGEGQRQQRVQWVASRFRLLGRLLRAFSF